MPSQGKIVVVVGGSSGFGHSVACLAMEEGASIVSGSRNPERLEEAAAELKRIGPDVR
jgi:NADP-dependent 3-hydroxy acid dehydrogenase YdfG